LLYLGFFSASSVVAFSTSVVTDTPTVEQSWSINGPAVMASSETGVWVGTDMGQLIRLSGTTAGAASTFSLPSPERIEGMVVALGRVYAFVSPSRNLLVVNADGTGTLQSVTMPNDIVALAFNGEHLIMSSHDGSTGTAFVSALSLPDLTVVKTITIPNDVIDILTFDGKNVWIGSRSGQYLERR
jgi:hypothetical protein